MIGVVLDRLDLHLDDFGLLLLERLEQRPELGGLVGAELQPLGHDVGAVRHEVIAELRDGLFLRGGGCAVRGGLRLGGGLGRPYRTGERDRDGGQELGIHAGTSGGTRNDDAVVDPA